MSGRATIRAEVGSMHIVHRASRAAASAARAVSRVSSLERCSVAVIPTTATTSALGAGTGPVPLPLLGAATRRRRCLAVPANAASPQHAASANANDDHATASSSLASQLRAGLDYELRNGCPNARGKQYDDFQQFLLSHLGRLGAACGVSGEGELAAELAAIAQDARRYAAMDAEHRDGLLRRLGSALHHSQQRRRAIVSQPRATEAPRPWRPPTRDAPPRAREPKQHRRAAMDGRSDGNPEGTAASAAGLDLGGGRLDLKPPDVIVPASAARSQQQQQQQREEVPCVVVFDLETTGLNKDRNRIIEIAAANVSDPTHRPMSTLVNPGRFAVPPPVVALTGITNAMVSAPAVPSFQRAAELFQEYIDEARRRCGGASVLLAAHNARQFDAGFLQAEYRRLGRELPEDWRFVDTLPLARKTLAKEAVPGGSYKLESLAAHFGVDTAGASAHRAEADARMLGDVLQRLVGCSLENTAGTSIATDDVEKSELAEALRAMKTYSFSMGDPAKNSLRRQMAAGSASGFGDALKSHRGNGAPRWSSQQQQQQQQQSTPLGFGATSIVTSDGEDIDVESSANIPESELDDLTYSDDGDEEDDSSTRAEAFFAREEKELERASASASGKPEKRPFWIQADPINGFVPETMDFARMVEADEQAAAASAAGAGDADRSELYALHAKLRTDYGSWEEIPVDTLKDHGVSAQTVNKLRKAGVLTVEQTLRCYPRKYQEFARFHAGMQAGTAVLVTGRVVSYLKAPYSRKGWGKTPSTLLIECDDGEGNTEQFELKLWEYVQKETEAGLTPGAPVAVRGALSTRTGRGHLTLDKAQLAAGVNPDAEVDVVTTYPKKHDIAPDRWHEVQTAAVKALKDHIPADPMTVSLGTESSVLPELQLISHVDAMQFIHAPATVDQVVAARERLAFEELVLLQVSLLQERNRAQRSGGEGVSIVSTSMCDELRGVLDFSLTRGQETALEEILQDMSGTTPMLRLLQGDVGCGKTIVAALGLLAAVGNGHQGAFMAPTEVLATQHATTLENVFSRLENPPRVVLLTGSTPKKERDAALRLIESGEGHVVVGTHSLISDDVVFKSLGLAVVDEQHRFGVEQRAALAGKGPVGGKVRRKDLATVAGPSEKEGWENRKRADEKEADGDESDRAAWAAAGDDAPTATESTETTESIDDDDMVEWRHAPHVLAMSATPIPRTLAMCKHGEMALSSIDEKPAGRLPIYTKLLIGPDGIDDAHRAMVEEVQTGGQCYVITPLVNASTADSFERFKSAEVEHKRLVEKFPQIKFGILHGQMNSEEKAAALKAFADGHTQVLVATSVVEVGVDVPNASVIIIEDADRHGVSTLHQLRGRVGRGSRQSKCFLLVGDEAGYPSQQRLRVLERSNNGFHIAESDLRMRGAGDLLGTRQSGSQVSLFHASVATDLFLLEAARRAAAETIARANVRGENLPAPLAIALKDRPALVDLNV